MIHHHSSFPPIPDETAELAGILYGQKHIYIRLGKQLIHILEDLSRSVPRFSSSRTEGIHYLYAMITGIQYAEELNDRQVVEAISKRVDLKYALRLPINYPSLHPEKLCDFRRQIYRDQASQRLLQALFHHLEEIGLLGCHEGQSSSATAVLEAVCKHNRMDIVYGAVFRTLEALAVNNSEWLRYITLPHWYDRYRRGARFSSYLTPGVSGEALAHGLGEDIQYLLAEIEQAEILSISSLKEVQDLKQVEEEQFEQIIQADSTKKTIRFRAAGCASCSRVAGENKN